MTTINVVGQELTAEQNEHASLRSRFDLTVTTRAAVRLSGAARGEGPTVPLEASDDDLVELEYGDGTREWTTVGALRERYAGQAARGQGDAITVTSAPPDGATRGAGEMILKGLKLLGFDPSDQLATLGARAAADYFESRLEPGPGLYRLSRDGALGERVAGELPHRSEPILVLIHGTFSSTFGAFSQLFASREWIDLWEQYEGRIYGFNHRSLSQSPAENALELIGHLPAGARLHMISHSRGGLVGELLCMDTITPADWVYFEKAGRKREIETLRALAAQLQLKRLEVRRFVRVACPARGTLLAAQRLDRYLSVLLNLIGKIPALADNIVYDFAKATILTLIKKRADAGDLPGLEAMIPDSPLVGMLNRAGRSIGADLAVVAGDLRAGGGILNTLKTWATDAFFWQDHDLVVHTRAMYGGLERTSNASYYMRSAPDMDHFTYFSHPESRAQIVGWLTQKPGAPPDQFHSLAQVRERALTSSRAAPPADAPTVIVIPGVFASHLKVGRQRIWLDPERIVEGRLGRLALRPGGKQPAVQPDGIVAEGFADLIETLSARFQVLPFAYDWRQSLSQTAAALARAVEAALKGDRAVYLLAHSSGGLLARALLADRRDLWDRLCQRGGRLLMLGTPNHGTYAMLEVLTGQADMVRMLNLLDREHALAAICGQLRRYPGLVELLPHGRDDWQEAFIATLPAGERDEMAQQLAAARAVWARLADAVDPQHMCGVIGAAASTAGGARRGADGKLELLDSRAGDGFVTAELSRLPDVPTWQMDAAHGDLANRPDQFAALIELLASGATGRLTRAPATPEAAQAGGARSLRLVLYPNRPELMAAALGGTLPQPKAAAPPGPTITVGVVHASLEHARYPLAVGHYDGDLIVGAEAALDSRLGRRLTQRRLMNIYPGKEGTAEVILNPQGERHGEPKGALVIGLGEVGQLNPDILTKGVTEAALRLALARLEADAPAGSARGATLHRGPASAAFSTLLIGTRGSRALSIRSAVTAIVTGAVVANRILAERGLLEQVCVDAIEFVEIFGDLAAQAARAVIDVPKRMRITLAGGEQIKTESFLTSGEGGYAGQPTSDYGADWWQRLQIKEPADPITGRPGHGLEFVQLTERARAELRLQATQRTLVEHLVAQTIQEPAGNLDLPATLYDLLFPNELKEQPLESTNLLLILDRQAAQYPWEMLAERQLGARGAGGAELEPLAVRMGMVRQLETGRFRAHVHAPRSKNALVIGEPKLTGADYAPLPGARAEAEAVANLLESHDYAVTRCIGADAITIVTALYANEYRIIHIAGHGMYRPDCPEQSGVVLGDQIFLTAAEIGQLRVVPDLVFLNCCHIGRVDAGAGAGPDGRQAEQRAWNKLAASVSEELIAIGVRAVVAAGWAVNDRAARRFAEALYRALLAEQDGRQFGEAVCVARRAIYQSDPGTNTWGAYQCYGDPGFMLYGTSAQSVATPKHYVTQAELILELQNLQARASRTTDKGWRTRYTNELRKLEQRVGVDLLGSWRDGRLCAELGNTYAELGEFDEAITRYRDALIASSPSEQVSIRTIEQLANLEARLAVLLSLGEARGITRSQAGDRTVDQLMEAAEHRLQRLIDLAPNAERYALLGSYYKRLAIIRRADPAARAQALADAEMRYDHALKQPIVPDPQYHQLNQTVCRYLRDDHVTDEERAMTIAQLTRIREDAAKAGAGFWSRIVRPDADLALALVVADQGAIAAQLEQLAEGYRRELNLGATGRQRSTVREHIQFIALILAACGKEQEASALQQLYESLDE